MRLTLSSYVTVERDEGRSIYVCQPLRGPQITTRDPLLGNALAKLGNKMRKTINEWIKDGKSNRVIPWLYDPEIHSRVEKMTLVLRDRTLRWKILLVALPGFDRHIAFSPSIPDVVFEVSSLSDLDARAVEVFTDWAGAQLPEAEGLLSNIGKGSDMWTEPIEVDVETAVRNRKKSSNILAALFGEKKMSGAEELHKVGQCLDDVCGDFEPALGRSHYVDEVDRMLLREDRQGVLLVGPTACGKTAIIRECTVRRAHRFHRRRGHKPQVWWLSPQRLISGMSYLGQWEQRWLAILREANKRDHVLYFDDLVGLFTAGRTRDSSLSAADVLRSYLAENRVRILAESTEEQLAILRRRDRTLADQFHLVHVPAISSEDALPIVLQSTANVESQSDRFFHPETIPLIMQHQEIFSPDRAFPGKAIDMTKTLAKHATQVVDRGIFYRLAGNQVGANLMLLVGRLGDQHAIGNTLSEQLIGQPDAVNALSRIVVRFAQHLQPSDRPLGVLLFLGPTGVGKTESAKALTRLLYSDESHLVRLDMNEMTTPYAAEQLVGTFDQPDGRLTAAVRRQPNCVILLDEIEKAHPDVFDYLLQVIGEGRLTDARGRVADFRSSIILLTSNLGAAEQTASLGFETTAARRTQIYKKAAQSFFRPEFFNRIDDVVAFRSLDASDMQKIVRIQMDDVLSRDGLQRRDVYVNVNESAIKRVIQTGFDSQLGARAVRRMLEREIIGPLGDCLANLAIDHPALVHIADSPSQSGVDCEVTPLKMCHTATTRRCSELSTVLEIGDTVAKRLDERLATLSDELQRVDERLGEKTRGASYYALREYVHRCSDLLKAGKSRLSRKSEPKLGLTMSPGTRPKRDMEGTGSRRQLLDWQAQEDLRSAISEGTGDALEGIGEDRLAREIVNGLTTASALIDHALSPRSCLLGFTHLTDSSIEDDEQVVKRQTGRDYEIYGHTGGAHDFLIRLVNCLRHGWQYEVDAEELPNNFWHVSGVSLLGILQPLLGTYRTDMPGKPSHLSVLRAIPIPMESIHGETGRLDAGAVEAACPPQPGREEELRLLAADNLRGKRGELLTPEEQSVPTDTIRGVVGERAVDYVSGAEFELLSDDWFRSEKNLSRLMDWWIECLPVPRELQEE